LVTAATTTLEAKLEMTVTMTCTTAGSVVLADVDVALRMLCRVLKHNSVDWLEDMEFELYVSFKVSAASARSYEVALTLMVSVMAAQELPRMLSVSVHCSRVTAHPAPW
jgi:hypothetical protein